MVSFFLYDERKQLEFRNAKCSAALPFGKSLGNHFFQVVLSVKMLESHTPRDVLEQSHCFRNHIGIVRAESKENIEFFFREICS